MSAVARTSPLSPALERSRDAAAHAAAALVETGMVVGLGTGDTARRFLEKLAVRSRDEGLRLETVATSDVVAERARALGLTVRGLAERSEIDLAVDGADEVDPTKNLIKGAGGAHTREKIVAASAARFVIVVDETKLVPRLGERAAVPVEVVPEALDLAVRRIRRLGGQPTLRLDDAGDPWRTDFGNRILDARFSSIADAAALEADLNRIPGVLDNGLFIDLVSIVLVGLAGPDGVRRID